MPELDPPTVTVSGAASYAAASDVFTLTPDAMNQTGAVMSNDRIDLTQDFTITFSAFLGSNDAGGDGIAFVLHNDPSGADAIGGGGGSKGAVGIANGLAISLDTYSNPGEPAADYHSLLRYRCRGRHHADQDDISVKPRKLAMAQCDGVLECRNADTDLLG